MTNDAELRLLIKEHLESIKNPQGVYDLFKKLNYPKKEIFDPSYIRKLSDFELAKEEKEKIKKIYTIMSVDKLNVFLVEAKSLTRPFVRYISKIFSDMYIQFLLFITVDYSEIHVIFPDYEKKEVGKHKLKTTTLNLKRDELYYTDIEIISNIYLADEKSTWRDIWRIWKDAFNVEKVTKKFFEDYQEIFLKVRKDLKKQKVETKTAHEFTLQLLNRIMFIYFISKKGWLNDDKKFMKSYWGSYKALTKFGKDEFYLQWLHPLFFEAFNNKFRSHPELPESVNKCLTNCPYLNGGLFTKKKELDDLKINISDNLFKSIFDFFEKFNFTIKEDSVLDVEVSVDPQMIGYVYESLANVAQDVYEQEEDLRGDWGIFYTPKVEVDFMCRRSLVEYLANNTDIPKKELYEFVFDEDKEKIEKVFEKGKYWRKIEEVMDNLSVVDPACGSGAFLVGMLNVLVELYRIMFKHTKRDLTDFEMKYRIIQRSLYGVDVMPWAIHAAELRLWLQLIVETAFKDDELRKHPLLPNLNMNLRIGDSLVQEIGGISFNVRTNNLKSFLKKKLEELKNEKRKYFENSPSAKYKTPEEFKAEEVNLFEEIINERIECLKTDNTVLANSEKKKERQTGLFGAQVNVDAENIKKEKQELVKIERQIEANEEEICKLEKVKELLHDPETKPFVWDIDFAEIFADKNGFDVVIGNPPYVRQEKISPPNILKEEINLDDRKAYKDRLIASVKNQFGCIDSIDKKSDYYMYFYFHGLSLLNEKGTFCFITSNSWLDVGYGKELQEFLLKYAPIIAIYDNPKRSFAHADVNTIIALFGAPLIHEHKVAGFRVENNNGWSMLGHIAKFVMFQRPFEEVISSKNLIPIENIDVKIKGKSITELVDNVVKTTDYRVFPITQEDLMEDGWEYPEEYKNGRFKEGCYEGNKWGGKYLRAPDILFTFLQKGKKLQKIKTIAAVRFGIKTGANDFFYLNQQQIDEWKIEKQFLKSTITSAKESKSICINPDELPNKLFYCNLNKVDLVGTKALKYIEWGENADVPIKFGADKGKIIKGYNNIDSVKGRNPWYSIGNKQPADAIILRRIGERMPFFESNGILEDCNLFGINIKKLDETKEVIFAILNSTLTRFHLELMTRQLTGGQAVADTNVYVVENTLIIKPSLVNNKKLLSSYTKLRKREAYSVFMECGFDSSKPIREQEPKPLPERAELDKVIFDELGLTKEERKEMYWAVCELVKQRLDKAKSLKED